LAIDLAVAPTIETLEARQLLSASLSFSGTQAITPSTALNVSNDYNETNSGWQDETSLAINPANPLNVAGLAVHYGRSDGNHNQLDLYYTTDGGATWNTSVIDGADDGIVDVPNERIVLVRSDPAVVFDDEGKLFICYVELDRTADIPVDTDWRLFAATSDDGGATFGEFQAIEHIHIASPDTGFGIDKPYIATGIDPASGNSAVYIAYDGRVNGSLRVKVAGTRDGGENWDRNVVVNDGVGSIIFPQPAVGPNGELYVSWYDVSTQIYFDADADGLWGTQEGFGTDHSIHTLTNGGLLSYTEPRAQPDRGVHTGLILTVDRSGGAYNGRLYIAFVELNGSQANHDQDCNIKFGYSTNGGTSWTFSTVDSSTGTEFLPWLDVDQATGSVHIFYYTTNGDQNSGNEDVKARIASSFNGGSNWTIAYLTTATSDEYENGDNDPEESDRDYGDYTGFDVHQGTAHALFAFEPSQDNFDLEATYVSATFFNENNTLTITGTSAADTIEVRLSSTNDDYLEVVVNNETEFVGGTRVSGRFSSIH
jgi:hypothetical protein